MEETNLLFPVIELVSRSITLTQISLSTDTSLLQRLRQLLACAVDLGPLLIRRLRGDPTWDNDDLHTRHPRRQDQTLIVAMYHDHHTDRARRQTP